MKKKYITVTGINPISRYGIIEVDNENIVASFKQKPQLKNHIVNAGFFVCEKEIFDYIKYDDEEFEETVLEKSA